jgi:hypothetical protein
MSYFSMGRAVIATLPNSQGNELTKKTSVGQQHDGDATEADDF